MSLLRYAVEQRAQQPHFSTSADQRHRRAAASLGTLGDHAPDMLGGIEPLERYLAQRFELDQIFHGVLERIGDERLCGFGPRLQPSREVDRAADNTVLGLEAAASAARHHSSAGDADMDRQCNADFRAQGGDDAVNVLCRLHRPIGIIAVRHRRTEHSHHVVADMALDGAAKARDRAVHGLEEASKNAMGVLGIASCGERRVTRQVSEQDRDLAALAEIFAEIFAEGS
jgi:hypothetical protein